MFKKISMLVGFLLIVMQISSQIIPAHAAPDALTAQPNAISYWGANVYLTKLERIDNKGANDNLDLLATEARAAGIQWSLEEFPWANIEPTNGNFSTLYDANIKRLADNNFGIIGMLLTTPEWARETSCKASYWCPPANVNEYAQFAGWMAERYDGDGISDAPGSPKIHAWQIWNEPNYEATWNKINNDENQRRRRYGDMLVASYNAIKAANPSAIVIAGGVYMYDGSDASSDGFNFFNAANGVFKQVPAAKSAFNVFGIHPYMPSIAPDDTATPATIVLEGRLINTREWLDNSRHNINRPDAPIWITEIGWCTINSTACPAVSTFDQANYLIRSFVIAQQLGIQHTNWLQYEDAFDGGHPFSGSAMVENYNGTTYLKKPAYLAYQTMTFWLNGATPLGARAGVHTHVYNPSGLNNGGVYDYRYVKGTTEIDVIWRPNGATTIQFPVTAGKTYRYYTRNNQPLTPTVSNGFASLPIGVDPIFMVQEQAQILNVQPNTTTGNRLVLLAQDSDTSASGSFTIDNGGTSGTFAWSSSCSNGVTLNPASGTGSATPSVVRVSINIGSLGVGDYPNYDCTISATGGVNATKTIYFSVKIVAELKRTYLPLVLR